MTTEIAAKAGFDKIRYAQLWEDGDLLLAGLGDCSGGKLVSIASAGDNALSMLCLNPKKVVAADLSVAQLNAVRIRIAAYTNLAHEEFLELIGSRNSTRRLAIFDKVLRHCDTQTADFWINLRTKVAKFGIGGVGKFERYFRIFSQKLLPLVHDKATIKQLFADVDKAQRQLFLDKKWNNLRWRFLLNLFFSRTTMGLLGRDPAFFDHVEGSVPTHIARRVKHCVVDNEPARNPYLHWIMYGNHGDALSHAYRVENFSTIRDRLDRLELFHGAIEDAAQGETIDGWNLSDIFEYMSPENFAKSYGRIIAASNPNARLVYWNMMAPRSRPDEFADKVQIRDDLAAPLFARDKAFFYSAFRIEQII